MKKFRIVIVVVLAIVGLVLLASEPIDDCNWFSVMFWKSLAGFGCWCVCALLYKRWDDRGLLTEDENKCNE